jgi:hypothetical protein
MTVGSVIVVLAKPLGHHHSTYYFINSVNWINETDAKGDIFLNMLES